MRALGSNSKFSLEVPRSRSQGAFLDDSILEFPQCLLLESLTWCSTYHPQLLTSLY